MPLDVTLVMRASVLIGEPAAHVEGLRGAVQHVQSYFDKATMQSLRLVLLLPSADGGSGKDDNNNVEPAIHVVLETALAQTLGAASAAGTANGTGGLPLDISMVTVPDNGTGVKTLMRQLMRQSMAPGLRSAPIAMDLPETVDGMQCQLLLDASYNVLSTSLQNQPAWDQLSADLTALSHSAPLTVRQLVPYAALDASLLFGVPLRLSSSAQNSPDWQDFQTMQILFGSVLQHLQERELVLLLQVPESSSAAGSGVWLGRPGQCLALMARETTQGTTTVPQTALLWGYATSCQWLRDDEDLRDFRPSALDDETTIQLQSYVGASLDSVICGPYNPLVPHASDLWNAEVPSQDAVGLQQNTTMVEQPASDLWNVEAASQDVVGSQPHGMDVVDEHEDQEAVGSQQNTAMVEHASDLCKVEAAASQDVGSQPHVMDVDEHQDKNNEDSNEEEE